MIAKIKRGMRRKKKSNQIKPIQVKPIHIVENERLEMFSA
jgi:hypothetical protein